MVGISYRKITYMKFVTILVIGSNLKEKFLDIFIQQYPQFWLNKCSTLDFYTGSFSFVLPMPHCLATVTERRSGFLP